MIASMYQLWMLGALDHTGRVTDLGKKMVQFPLDPPLSKILIYAQELGFSDEVMTVVTILSVTSIFYR